MEHEYQHAIPLSIMVIWAKAKSLFDEPDATDQIQNFYICCLCWVV
jgi:hypothetical protein